MKRVIAYTILAAFLQAVVPQTGDPAAPCSNTLTPPFVTNAAKPNILIILDNSNSMDEDFYGNAVGSWSSASKSVIARKALRTAIANLKGKANVGLMTFNLPYNNISKSYLYNSVYFGTYNSNAFCGDTSIVPATPPDPLGAPAAAPAACVQYCLTGDATAQSNCETQCRTKNSSFSSAFTDTILSTSSPGSSLRNTYCSLIYPKTQRLVNPADTSHYIYFKGAYPTYTGSSDYGSYYFRYAGDDLSGTYYVPYNNVPTYTYTYKQYTTKTGTADDKNGYTGLTSTATYGPSDSDKALGYYNFGQRRYSYKLGQSWFTNYAAPTSQMGYLKVPAADLSNTTNYNNVYNMLDPKENDSAGYLGCTATDENTCPYIINAGLTPTAGTLKTAYNYFNNAYAGKFCVDSTSGITNAQACTTNTNCPSDYHTCTATSSPITLKCQKNFIIFVTDGLPSTKLDGTSSIDISTVMPEVITQLTGLKTGITKTISGTSYTFPVKTYVLGMGLSAQAKTNLDQMAVAGGTQTSSGHAYYADDPTQLTNALAAISTDLLARVASGSSISILSEGQTHMGANMLQGVFYPKKDFGTSSVDWPGYLYDYWFYNKNTLNNIREDTVHDYILDLDQDYGIVFSFDDQTGLSVNRYSDPTGSGDPSTFVDKVDLDSINPIWEAGKQLFKTTWDSRRVWTSDSSGLGDFNTTNTSLTTGSSPLGSTTNMDACLATDPAYPTSTTLQNLIKYVRGYDLPNCRKRAMGLCSNPAGTDYSNRPCSTDGDCTVTGYTTCRQGIWKLGDIVYSTPKVQIDYQYCFNGTSFDTSQFCTSDTDCSAGSTCKKMENVVFVGANDGMLHAFRTGLETNSGVDATSHQIEQLNGVPDPTTGVPATSGMGTELWAFIPKNSLPYLRCLAAPAACHLYYNDLSPYITTMTTKDGKDRTILIGGMRLGGAALTTPSKYCYNNATPPVSNSQTCSSTSDCTSPYNVSCTTPKYCFNSSGQSNGVTCSATSDCTSPYNSACVSATDANVYSSTAPADTCSPVQCTDPNTCYNPTGCTGLSSYYAIDITDVESPKLLWEFSHPLLGYSYSGPAVIRKWYDTENKMGDQYYVMFGSGPTDPALGTSTQNVMAFVLKLKTADLSSGDSFKIESVYVKDFGVTNKNGFTGRLFTTGLDVNSDGYTDFVLMGFGFSPTGEVDKLKGGIAKINTTNIIAKPTVDNIRGLDPSGLALDPASWTWDFATYNNIAQLPITAKIESATCFTNLYLYFGTGRYFFPLDDYGPNGASGQNYLTGVPFTCDQWNLGCAPNINSANPNNNACSDLTGNSPDPESAFWQLILNDDEGVYLKERMTTDPSTTNTNKVYFTTAEPTGDACGYGGRSRVWGLNCATGASIADTSCTGYTVTNMTGTLYLQTSTGAIYKIDPGSSFTDTSTGNRTTGWMVGMPPENAPPVVNPASPGKSGTVIQWIEK